MSRYPLPIMYALALALLGPATAFAQTNERIYENLNFRFVTPGARPAGMGMKPIAHHMAAG